MLSILWTILIGFVVGLIARAIMPGSQKMGFIMTSVLGIAGSMAAFYGGAALGLTGPVGFIGSVIGAIVLLFAYELIRKNMR